MAKQSSIEYALDKLENLIPPGNQMIIRIIIEQAKAMHKDEICKSYVYGAAYRIDVSNGLKPEIYYNETFGGNNE